MPKREVTSAPWVPVPARAYTGKAPRARQHRAVGRLSAGAPRLHKSCRWRRPQSKGRSCRSGRARRDLRVRGGRGHLSERPGWPSGSPISRGSTVSMIAFGGRRGPHRSGSRCRGRPIERREAGREGCLWPNAASQGRPPDGSGGESERSTQNGRAKTLCGGGGGGGGGSNSELPQAGFPESGEVSVCCQTAVCRRCLVSPIIRSFVRSFVRVRGRGGEKAESHSRTSQLYRVSRVGGDGRWTLWTAHTASATPRDYISPTHATGTDGRGDAEKPELSSARLLRDSLSSLRGSLSYSDLLTRRG